MELIPRVVWVGNSVNLRYQDIYTVSNSISMAASIACSSGFPDVALEWLERRSVAYAASLVRPRTAALLVLTRPAQIHLEFVCRAFNPNALVAFRPIAMSLRGPSFNARDEFSATMGREVTTGCSGLDSTKLSQLRSKEGRRPASG